jgi:hypothetical protein
VLDDHELEVSQFIEAFFTGLVFVLCLPLSSRVSQTTEIRFVTCAQEIVHSVDDSGSATRGVQQAMGTTAELARGSILTCAWLGNIEGLWVPP